MSFRSNIFGQKNSIVDPYAAPTGNVPMDGLIAFYKFNELSGSLIDHANNYDGTVQGSVLRESRYYEFNLGGQVNLFNYGLAYPFSVSFVFASYMGNHLMSLCSGIQGGIYKGFLLDLRFSNIRLMLGNGGGGLGGNRRNVFVASPINFRDDKKHAVTIVFNSFLDIQIAIDDVPKKLATAESWTGSATFMDLNTSYNLMRRQDLPTADGQGLLFQNLWYNRALTDTEILQINSQK